MSGKGSLFQDKGSHEANAWKNMLIRFSFRRLSLLHSLSLSRSVSAKSNTPSWDKCVCSRQKAIVRGSMLHKTMRITRTASSRDIASSFIVTPFSLCPFCFNFSPHPFLSSQLFPPLYYYFPHSSPSLFWGRHYRSLLPEMPAWLRPLLLSCSCVEEL